MCIRDRPRAPKRIPQIISPTTAGTPILPDRMGIRYAKPAIVSSRIYGLIISLYNG